MILKIINKKEDKYFLINKDGNKYVHTFRFYDLAKSPSIGDTIEIKDEMLDVNFEEYSDIYLFGALNQPYGRVVKSKDDTEVVRLEIDGKQIYLKRFFG